MTITANANSNKTAIVAARKARCVHRSLQADNRSLQFDLRNYKTAIVDLQRQLTAAQDECRRHLTNVDTVISIMNAEKEHYIRTKTQLDGDLEEARLVMADQATEIQELQDYKRKSDNARQENAHSIAGLEESNRRLTNQNNSLSFKESTQGVQLRGAQSRIKEYEDRITDDSYTIEELNRQLKFRDDHREEFEANLKAAYDGKLSEQNDTVERLKEQVEQLQWEREQRIEQAEDEDGLTTEDRLERKHAAQFAEKNRVIIDLKKELIASKERHTKAMRQLRYQYDAEESEEKDRVIQELKEELVNSEKRHKDIMRQLRNKYDQREQTFCNVTKELRQRISAHVVPDVNDGVQHSTTIRYV